MSIFCERGREEMTRSRQGVLGQKPITLSDAQPQVISHLGDDRPFTIDLLITLCLGCKKIYVGGLTEAFCPRCRSKKRESVK